ncbi:hypothetical protein HPB47_022219 [Ixodes persulcatus]|uniref:Uncharacterized protein n=1 Tax=Ixodes persulcatus TaxID=34615 RepID=A0AC60QC67_IXOPE|nr:hypothetical protein HPB47_022219 [Ixodes persulcatus]
MEVQQDEFEENIDQGDMDRTGILGYPENSETPGAQEASGNAPAVATHSPSQRQPKQHLERQASLQDDRTTPHSEQAVPQTQPDPRASGAVDDNMELGEAASTEVTTMLKGKGTMRDNAAGQSHNIVSGK